MRKPKYKTHEQLEKMTKSQFNKHLGNVKNYSHTVNYSEVKDMEVREYIGALIRIKMNRWGRE